MKNSLAKAALSIGLFLFAADPCFANFDLTLSSPYPNLQDIPSGPRMSNLTSIFRGLAKSGNPAGLFGFEIQLSYGSGPLSAPTSILPGSAIPDPTGFIAGPRDVGTPTTEIVAIYGSSSPITSNGELFSFDVSAQQLGSSTVQFIFVGSNDSPPPNFDVGNPLPYTVGPSAVPEPLSIFLLCSGGVSLWLYRVRRQSGPGAIRGR